MSRNVNFEPKFLESRRDLFCLSFGIRTLIFHSTEIKKTQSSAMSLVIHCINNFTITVTPRSNSQEFGRCFPIHSYGDIFNIGSAMAPAYVCLQYIQQITEITSAVSIHTVFLQKMQMFLVLLLVIIKHSLSVCTSPFSTTLRDLLFCTPPQPYLTSLPLLLSGSKKG